MQYKTDDVLAFLCEWKSRKELEVQFGLSNSESWHLVRWLGKANLIDTAERIPVAGKPNRINLYRAKPHEVEK